MISSNIHANTVSKGKLMDFISFPSFMNISSCNIFMKKAQICLLSIHSVLNYVHVRRNWMCNLAHSVLFSSVVYTVPIMKPKHMHIQQSTACSKKNERACRVGFMRPSPVRTVCQQPLPYVV
jgi:hypothetical protein